MEVIELCVAPGDDVEVDDPLIVIESDKASMEVPSPFAGTLRNLKVVLGDLVNAGDVIATIAGAVEADGSVEEQSVEEPATSSAPPAQSAAAERAPDPAPAATPEAPDVTPGTDRVYAGPAVRRLARELGATSLPYGGPDRADESSRTMSRTSSSRS